MTTIYQIKDWNRHFENAKSKTIQRKSWCPLPNKQDGLGYGNLLAREDGAALYGAFVAVVLRASRQPPPRQGYLTDTGYPEGIPLTAQDLATTTKIARETIQMMLDACSHPNIGWITVYNGEDTKYPPREDSRYPPYRTGLDRTGPEGKGIEPALEPASEAARFFNLKNLQELWGRLGWKTPAELQRFADQCGRGVEYTVAMLLSKHLSRRVRNPAGAAMRGFQAGHEPSEAATNFVLAAKKASFEDEANGKQKIAAESGADSEGTGQVGGE